MLLIPGIGTVEHLKLAYDCGVATVRVATHYTEADVSEQHISSFRRQGLDTVGFLMMAHMAGPEEIARQGKLMESYGANCIYCTDSAGHMLPIDVTEDLMERAIRIDRDALILGYAGVYLTFLLFAKRTGAKYGVPSADILVELGRLKVVGGQEDMIEDTALNLARARRQIAGASAAG